MSAGTLTYSGTLIAVTCWCSMAVAIPETLYAEARRSGTTVYCPLGHAFSWKETEADRLKRDLQWERDRVAQLVGDRDQLTATLRTTRGHITRLRKRVTAGACPFGCHRHFADLQRHVASKHPNATLPEEVLP